MIMFLALFIPVAALTLLADFGGRALARQRDELLPLLNFEPFVYLLFLFAGLSMLFAVRSRFPRWFATFFMVPFAGALSGWSFGLTLVVLLQGMWRPTLFGVALTAFVALFCLSPVFITRVATGLAQEIRGKLFRRRHDLLMVNGMGVIFVAAGAVGLWGLYGG